MKISCQNCSSKYTVSDEKVQGKTVKLKCKKCGATILVNAGGATTVAGGAGIADHASSPAEPATSDGMSYLVNVAEGDQRTMTVAELVAAYQSQIVTADTYIWADGMGDWQPLGQVEAIVSALSAGTPAAPAPAPSYAPMAAAPPSTSSAEAAASAASLAASARPAARREPSKRADVFGNEKSDDVATSAPLFSASAKAAASNAAAAAKSSQPREENSVLFSLNALTSSKPGAAPAASPSRKDSREDSGLIDLKALAAAAAPSPAAASASAASSIIGHDDAGLFPLGVPSAHQPAAPPVAANVTVPPPAASKAPMYIGIGALVAALAIVGVFFAMRGGDEKPVADTMQPTATTPAAAPTPAPTPTQTATAEPTAEPTSSATSTAVAAKGTAPTKGGAPSKGGTSKGGTTGSAPAGGGASTAAAPAKPKGGGCGCAPGDLMCAMKCSAK